MKNLLLLSVALCLAGCTVGPDYERPAAPSDAGYSARPLPDHTASTDLPGGDAQHFVAGMDISAQWWSLFRSPALDRLVEQALKGNPSMDAATASLRQAHELTSAQWASLFPTLSGGASATRNKNPGRALSNPSSLPQTSSVYSLYTAQLSLTYAVDIFGGNRRALEAVEAQENATRYQLEATYITLTSNVVVTAIAEAALRGQIEATQRLLAIQHELTETMKKQRAIGTASELDLLAQQAAEAQTMATLPPLQKQLAQTRDALTALLGLPSAQEPPERFSLSDLTLPVELPASVPSKLVEQRPDVRQAEEALHIASAEVGVALADMLPQMSITGSLGSQALKPQNLFFPNSGSWLYGTSLTQTLFDAGALLHKRRAADAALDAAAAQYRSTVIAAIQNVADSLQAVEADAEAMKASAEAERAAKASFALTKQQYTIGTVSVLMLLNAEQTCQTAEIALVQAQAARYSDTAGLFLALGGGWWNRSVEAAAR